jgi:mannose-6-phosphate isomerase-like protein (cupin superfamily)
LLELTGAEISINRVPPGEFIPFTHTHKENEEVYIVLRGSGFFFIDGEEFPIQEGSVLRVDPAGERAWKSGGEDMYFICIQAKQGSIRQTTRQDGARGTSRPSWMAKEA